MDKRAVNWRKFYDINFVNVHYQPFDASGWQPVDSGLLGPVRLAPAVADGKVYAGSDDGFVYCLDARTGQQRGPEGCRIGWQGSIDRYDLVLLGKHPADHTAGVAVVVGVSVARRPVFVFL